MIVTDTQDHNILPSIQLFCSFFEGAIKKKKIGPPPPPIISGLLHIRQIYLGFRTNLVENFANFRRTKTYLRPKFQNSIRDQHPLGDFRGSWVLLLRYRNVGDAACRVVDFLNGGTLVGLSDSVVDSVAVEVLGHARLLL